MKNIDIGLLKWLIVVVVSVVSFCPPVFNTCNPNSSHAPLAAAKEGDKTSQLEYGDESDMISCSMYEAPGQAPTDLSVPAAQQAPVTRPDWSKERVLLFGDSLAVGLAPFIEKELNDRGVGAFRNISIGGTMINQWTWSKSFEQARYLDRELAEFRPTMVIFSLGTNDEAFRGTLDHKGDPIKPPYGPNFSVARLRRASIAELSSKLSGVRTRIWICPPITSRWPPDRAFREEIRNWGGGFFDSQRLTLSKQGDRLHMTPAGNRTWTNAIMEFLDQL